MKILYLSCHEILEHQELTLLTELGHDVFSVGGAFQNPFSPGLKRPPILGMQYHEHLSEVAIQCSKENLHPELIEWADVIIVMHRPDWIISNWQKIRHKRVIWRTIGQSISQQEASLELPRRQGMQIVRYSPREDRIPGYLGKDSLIRFYVCPSEYDGWTGEDTSVITVAQSMKTRGKFCGFETFEKATQPFPRFLYGPGNEDSGIPGGQLSYEDLKERLRRYRVFFYTGTYPASYTLGFIEAFMMGIPIVAAGPGLWDAGFFPNHDLYEVHLLLGSEGEAGYWADTIPELQTYIRRLLLDEEEAQRIHQNARAMAIKLFSKDEAKKGWKEFL